MSRARLIMLSASLNFRKWRGDWRMAMIALGAICFAVWNARGFARLGLDYGMSVTAWVFPHMYAHPLMMLLYGYFVVALFSDAPFMDGQTMFWLSRCGRLEWILGQMIYIVLAALAFALFLALSPILALLPNVSFAPEWGDAMLIIADNSDIRAAYDMALPALTLLTTQMGPVSAMLISTLMAWLVAAFMGALMLCANLLLGAYAGATAGSILTFFSYLTSYFSHMIPGINLYYLSPVNWMSIYGLNWLEYAGGPPPAYGAAFLVAGAIALFALSALAFCRRDVTIRQGGILQ